MGIDENNSVFKKIKNDNHEQIVFCNDDKIGLKAIIGIHNTVLGPAIGGTRMWDYISDEEWEKMSPEERAKIVIYIFYILPIEMIYYIYKL